MTAKVNRHGPTRILGLFSELGGVGGIQESGRLTALALRDIARKNGWSTEFLTLNDSHGPQVFRLNGTEVPYRGFGRSKMQFVRRGLLASRKTQIILAAHPHLAVPAAQMKLVAPNCNVITISHGIEVWTPLPWFRRLMFRRSDLLLAPSRYTADKLIDRQGVPADKVRRLPWPLSPEILRMAESRANLPLPPGFPEGLVVLSVARLDASEKYKGVDKLIECTAHLRSAVPNLHLVVVGGGSDLARHTQLARDLRVADCVHFFDKLSRAEIAACYARCDVFAMPSTGEGFGLVFLEAMAFEKPLIGAAAGGIPDVIEDGTNGFLVPTEDSFDGPAKLRQAMEKLLCEDYLRATFGQRGGEIVRSKYAFDEFSSRLECTLRDCGLE